MKRQAALLNQYFHNPTVNRVIWGVILFASVAITLLGIPARWRELIENAWITVFSKEGSALFVLVVEIIVAITWFATATFIVWKNPINRLVFFLGLTAMLLGLTQPGMTDALINAWYSSKGAIFRAPVYTLRALAAVFGLVALYIFPDGKFAFRSTKILAQIWILVCFVWLIVPDSPFNVIYGDTWRATPIGSLLFSVFWFSTGIIVQILRYSRTEDAIQRQQIKWLALGLTTTAIGATLYHGSIAVFYDQTNSAHGLWDTAYYLGRPLIQLIAMNLIPIYCLGVAIFRHRLWDLDSLVNRTLVYGTLTTSIILLYTLIVAGLSALLRLDIQSEGNFLISLFATGIIAVVFQPLRERLQRGVNRLMYGDRDDLEAVLARLGEGLEAARTLDDVLSITVQTTTQALKLPYASIRVKADENMRELIFESPSLPEDAAAPAADLLTIPLIYQSEGVGKLMIAPRTPGEAFNRADRVVIGNIARQAGAVAYSVRLARRLTEEIQQSRSRILNAREQERKRLHQDLHDGLGPSLASLVLQLDAARNLLTQDLAAVDTLIVDIKSQTGAAIEEIRRLVRGLRPPVLDLGLIPALHAVAIHYRSKLQVEVEAPETMPELPEAIVIAAFGIVTEAINNTSKHAQAQRCNIRFRVENGLVIEISDNGRGLPPQIEGIFGLNSMRDRATEPGGTFQLKSQPGHGTSIHVWLPLQE